MNVFSQLFCYFLDSALLNMHCPTRKDISEGEMMLFELMHQNTGISHLHQFFTSQPLFLALSS